MGVMCRASFWLITPDSVHAVVGYGRVKHAIQGKTLIQCDSPVCESEPYECCVSGWLWSAGTLLRLQGPVMEEAGGSGDVDSDW